MAKFLRRPASLQHSTHLDLLNLIRGVLLARSHAGSHILLAKVKSHIGILGNEAADAAAKLPSAAAAEHDFTTPAHNPLAGRYWPAILPPPDSSASERPVTYLHTSLRTAVHAATRLGSSKPSHLRRLARRYVRQR